MKLILIVAYLGESLALLTLPVVALADTCETWTITQPDNSGCGVRCVVGMGWCGAILHRLRDSFVFAQNSASIQRNEPIQAIIYSQSIDRPLTY